MVVGRVGEFVQRSRRRNRHPDTCATRRRRRGSSTARTRVNRHASPFGSRGARAALKKIRARVADLAPLLKQRGRTKAARKDDRRRRVEARRADGGRGRRRRRRRRSARGGRARGDRRARRCARRRTRRGGTARGGSAPTPRPIPPRAFPRRRRRRTPTPPPRPPPRPPTNRCTHVSNASIDRARARSPRARTTKTWQTLANESRPPRARARGARDCSRRCSSATRRGDLAFIRGVRDRGRRANRRAG